MEEIYVYSRIALILIFAFFAFASFVQVHCSRASAGTLELVLLNIIYMHMFCVVSYLFFCYMFSH